MQHEILLPDLGQTTAEVRVVQWLKRRGDLVRRGEPLLCVETDKVDMEVEAFTSGYLRATLVEEGSLAEALSPVAILTDTANEPYSVPVTVTAAAASVAASALPPAITPVEQRAAAVPGARELARELGLNLFDLVGTGPSGLITRRDVQHYADRRRMSAPAAHHAWAAMAATVIASHRDIPHFEVQRDLDMAHASAWRNRWNASHPELHATLNDVFVRCAALALGGNARMRTSYEGGLYTVRTSSSILVLGSQDDAVVYRRLCHPGAGSWEEFLEGPKQTAAETPALAISNLGMHGVQRFTAIIPPGCTAVLAIGALRSAPIIQGGKLAIAELCTVTISADHRVLDGVAVARYLQSLQQQLDSL